MKANRLKQVFFKSSGFLQKNSVFFPKSYKAFHQNRPKLAHFRGVEVQTDKKDYPGNLKEIESS
jgi:hypothetical protein